MVPGYLGAERDTDVPARAAERSAIRCSLRRSAGGGGKGMRLVARRPISAALEPRSARRRAPFGDSRVLIERYVSAPRHIEIQVFADRHGNTVHLVERDCSLQRRHQKVIEEAPAPLRRRCAKRWAMPRSRAARASAIEAPAPSSSSSITDVDGFYFMEMNTRLQVEHPVTETITGLDLVELQFKVAAGEQLPIAQDDPRSGHAIEARLYAEDPDRDFAPQARYRQHRLSWPEGMSALRIDTGVEQGGCHHSPPIMIR